MARSPLRAGTSLILVLTALAIHFHSGESHFAWGSDAEGLAAAAPFARTPARLKRGKYLVENVTTCFRCHSERAWARPGAPPIPSAKGAGNFFVVGAGPVDSQKLSPVYAPNITADGETGIGRWSDQAVARAIRASITSDGRSFPAKFHSSCGGMSDEDLGAIVVYLRTVPAVRKPAPATITRAFRTVDPAKLAYPLSVPQPELKEPVSRGEYLVRMADCASCHTADAPQAPLLDKKFGGGKLVSDNPAHYVVTPNITMDASGIGYYDEAKFVSVLRTGRVGSRKLYPIMPWGYFRNMSDQDLKAIFAYLKTVPPVQHVVDNTEPPTFCRRCLQRHGAGDRN